MNKICVKEEWCLSCRLCEYVCAYANSGEDDMVKALKDKPFYPRLTVEDNGQISFAVPCRHCEEPLCLKSCISGAISKKDGAVVIDKNKCVGCYTCISVCPYGAITEGENGSAIKCELCLSNKHGSPMCVQYCPNKAIVTEEAK